MSGSISISPYTTNQPASSFLANTQGYIQGVALDDPAVRMELTGGYLASTETVIMWGGIPITENINITTLADGLGSSVARSTSQGNTTGWSVYNQAAAFVIGPGNSAPAQGTGGFVPYYRNGSNARIVVACDPALVTSIAAGGAINSQALYWDTTNYRITLTTSSNFALPTSVRLLVTNTNSKIVSYNGTSKTTSWTTGDTAVILI